MNILRKSKRSLAHKAKHPYFILFDLGLSLKGHIGNHCTKYEGITVP